MANNLVSMQHIRVLIQHLIKGFSQRRIALELQLSRNTVKQYVERLLASEMGYDALLKTDDATLSTIIYAHAARSKIDPRKNEFTSRVPYWIAELKRRGVRKQLLWEEYKKECPEGYEYSQFCELLSEHTKVTSATMHFEHHPAEKMMVDFAGDNLNYVDKVTGELISCPVFVAVLPYSGYSYVMALSDMKQPSVVVALNNAIHYFGGLPQGVKFDNMKQAVSKSSRYEPVFADTMQQWALHNNITLLAARVRKPKDKPHVEAEVKQAYQRIYAPLRNEVFYSLSQMNAAITKQLVLHHEMNFQRKDYSRKDCFFKEEQPLLNPLPANTYCIKHITQAKVQRNYHIALGEDWHFYSVPFNYIGKKVNAVYDLDTVEIYHEHKRIALHVRSFKRHAYTTIKEHMPESHQRYSEQRGWDESYFLSEAKKIGTAAHDYIQKVLQGKHFKEQTYNMCLGILRLAKAYSSARVDAACSRALRGTVYNYRNILNILNNNLDTLEYSDQAVLFTMPKHTNLRGPKAYQ